METDMSKRKNARVTVPCPVCKAKVHVADDVILDGVKYKPALRTKVASLLGAMTGGKTKLDEEGRRQRALKAVQAREAKRRKGNS